jgi:hypothetical protein
MYNYTMYYILMHIQTGAYTREREYAVGNGFEVMLYSLFSMIF